MEKKKEDLLLVAAMDFGTAYSGYAFSFRDKPDDFMMNQTWNAGSQKLISLKTPTCLLLTSDQKFKAFGYDAENEYVTQTRKGEHKKSYFFEQFKMKLYDSKVCFIIQFTVSMKNKIKRKQ